MAVAIKLLTILSVLIVSTIAQENAQTRVPDSLAECYRDPFLLERDNRLPMTVNMLIELIRKVEDTFGLNQDIRTLAVSMLHRFRQDGIEREPRVISSRNVLPFSPSGFQFTKHRIILQNLIPGNAFNFPNSSLTSLERCSLHFMMSSTIETAIRGDENVRCAQLSQLRALRIPRSVEEVKKAKRDAVEILDLESNFQGDSEYFADLKRFKRRGPKFGKLQSEFDEDENADIPAEEVPEEGAEAPAEDDDGAPANDEDYADGEDGGGGDVNVDINFGHRNADGGLIDVATNSISQCPVESGVIHSIWGAIAGGPLIAGIAAGLEPQTVRASNILRGDFGERQVNVQVDNRYAATLSGDLAELSLLQGPVTTNLNIGATGGWNSTTVPRWYFLSQREQLEMTDAEIRGGLDGLILAMNIASWRSLSSTLKLSQLLDMYYSQRGVLSSGIRGCARNTLFTTVAPIANLQTETNAFATILDREMRLRVTVDAEGIAEFATSSAASLTTYIPSTMNDPTCNSASITPDGSPIVRTAAELYIFVDTTWQFREILPIVSYLLDNIDVNPYGTFYTIMNAMDGNVIVSRTQSLANMHTNWTLDSQQTHPAGLSLPNVLQTITQLSTSLLNQERSDQAVGGRSQISLIIPQVASVNAGDTTFSVQQIQIMKEQIPDMRILFAAAGVVNRFNSFVQDHTRDTFAIQIQNTVPAITNPIVLRMRAIPRRVINHRCGADWQSGDSGSNAVNQHVEPTGISYYRIHPNYFFGDGNRRVRIQGAGYGGVMVCQSRSVELPRVNTTNTDEVTCQQINTDSAEINLQSACNGHFTIASCPPVYFSIEGVVNAGTPTFRCTDGECRFPDNLRVSLQTENLGCFSGVERILGTFSLVLISILVVLRFWE